MKTKHIVCSFVVLIYFIPSIALSQGMDALDQAYKEQHDKYTSEINELQLSINREREALDKQYEIFERLRQLDLQDGSHRRRSRNSGTNALSDSVIVMANNLQKKIDKMKELSEKKSDLKIKVLEKKGVLPTWWTD